MKKKHSIGLASQSGYALLLVAGMMALMLVAAATIVPSILINGKREREQEMIWRGEQYVRGIKLYYRKLGRFPNTIDDLTKPKTGSIRFMRQAYKDPMNKEDGTWRLIYVGPAGQLIGSTKQRQAMNLQGFGTPVGAPQGGGIGEMGKPSAFGGPPPGGVQQAGPGGASSAATGSQQPQTPAGAVDDSTDPASMVPSDNPTIIGGNIIGVGSKINAKSVVVYEKAKNYRQFEFIWDPTKDTVSIGGQPGMQTGTGLGASPGGQPIGSPIGNPPPQTPPQNNDGQNPTPQQ